MGTGEKNDMPKGKENLFEAVAQFVGRGGLQ